MRRVARPQNVIIVNGTNPDVEAIVAKIKETGCPNLAFTGIGKVKAKKLVDSMPRMQIRYLAFRKLANASEEYFKDNGYTVVTTIGDFCKAKGRTKKAVTETTPEMPKEVAREKAEKFVKVLKELQLDIAMNGYSFFKELASKNGSTKTMRRGSNYYAYFDKLYVRF